MKGAEVVSLLRMLAAIVCIGSGSGCSRPVPVQPARMPWPPELPAAALPGAPLYVSEKSNVVLDFHGSVQDPDLVIFMAGNQYRALPELIAEFRGWIATQPRHRGAKVQRIFYATTPPGRLIEAMESGQLAPRQFLDRRATRPAVARRVHDRAAPAAPPARRRASSTAGPSTRATGASCCWCAAAIRRTFAACPIWRATTCASPFRRRQESRRRLKAIRTPCGRRAARSSRTCC